MALHLKSNGQMVHQKVTAGAVEASQKLQLHGLCSQFFFTFCTFEKFIQALERGTLFLFARSGICHVLVGSKWEYIRFQVLWEQ
jgi:hypothetical protein